MMEKQTAGRNQLGKLAPKFAELNDDVLFGEIWSREDKLNPRDRKKKQEIYVLRIADFHYDIHYGMLKSMN